MVQPSTNVGIEYKDESLEAIYNEEGRYVIDKENGNYYEFFLKDHLGNTRARFGDKDNNSTLAIDIVEAQSQDGETNLQYQEYFGSISYYPFGLEFSHSPIKLDNGSVVWTGDEGGEENRYTYNGKEFQEELGIDLHYYGFRMYDPAIARFTGVDPIAEDFAHLSTYNYADNSPIANIDLHGLQAVYAADGKLIQYSVQKGQGPTQVAKDLQENYRCQLSCDADWTQIVYDNGSGFQNVFDGDGNVTDKFNEDFESGNIQPGTILEITTGLPNTENEEGEKQTLLDTKDSLRKVADEDGRLKRGYELIMDLSKEDSYEDGGPGAVVASGMGANRKHNDSLRTERKIKKVDEKIDSINKVITDKKN